MNKIAAINGSPKANNSASGILISQIEAIAETTFTVYQAAKLIRQESISAAMADILNANVLLIVFPLYIDSLPAPVVKVLTLLEREAVKEGGQPPKVYSVCNCGFYEAENNRLALDIIRNFCVSAGLPWGYGIGIGAGGSIQSLSPNMSGGPMANVYAALCELVESIRNHRSLQKNQFLTPEIPRSVYLSEANKAWEQAADKYGKKASLRARPHTEKWMK